MTTLSFTAKKCPNAPGLENTCELPFGMLWTPFAGDGSCNGSSPEDNASTLDLDSEAALCLHCLAYRNPFVKVLDWDNGVWQCNICGSKNVVKGQRKALAEAIENSESNGFDVRDQLYCKPIGRRCASNPNLSENVAEKDVHSSVCYIFVIDLNIPTNQIVAMRDTIKRELKDKQSEKNSGMLGLIVFGKTVSVYKLGIRGIASAEVLKGDTDYFHYCQHASSYSSSKVSSRSSLSLVSLSDESSLDIFFQCLTAACGGDSSVDIAGNRTIGKKPTRSEILRKRREARERSKNLSPTQSHVDSHILPPRRTSNYKEFRCTGAAIETAISLAKSSECMVGRVILFTSGMPSIGPGAIVDPFGPKCQTQRIDTFDLFESSKYFRELGLIGMHSGIGIDVLCSDVVGIPALHALTRASDGYALLHNSFDRTELEWPKNLSFLLNITNITPSWECIISREFHPNEKKIDHRNIKMNSCVLDLKVSSDITPVQLIGPGEEFAMNTDTHTSDLVLPSEQTIYSRSATAAASHGLAVNASSKTLSTVAPSLQCRLLLGRKDPLSTLSVLFEVNNMQTSPCVYIQTICRWIEGSLSMTRITTARIPVAQNVNTFISSIQPIPCAVMLGKEAVLRSGTWIMGRYHNEDLDFEDALVDEVKEEEEFTTLARLDLDYTIQQISRAYRLLGNTRNSPSSSLSSLTYAFPSNLKPESFLRLLHHIRRGDMLGAGALLQTAPDDRHSMRDLFLRFPLTSCAAMMAPQLWRWREQSVDSENFADNIIDGTLNSTVTLESQKKIPKLEKIILNAVLVETLALWDDVILVADMFDSFVIWSGKAIDKNSEDDVMDRIKVFVHERCDGRFPAPQIHFLREGDSMSRKLTSRLVPSHKDPPEQQVALSPALASLPSHKLEELRNKFRYHDSTGDDSSFRKWFWDVASASAEVSNVGRSLCKAELT